MNNENFKEPRKGEPGPRYDSIKVKDKLGVFMENEKKI